MKLNLIKTLMVFAILILNLPLQAQNYEAYMPPQDSLAKIKLEKWQDMKFGLIMHWGLYSQIGVVESWGLCSEDQGFQDRKGMNYTDYKDMYFGLIKKFNPINFNPDLWADAAQKAGMKYVVFTTKHHDGFCMFDTKETDFKITGAESPFHNNPKANVAKYIFEAFRNKNFMIGAYFSKPDWHCPLYWSPLLATPNRNNNYDIKKYPDRWKAFQDYTFNQIKELTTGYGRIDILWFDGGWVRPDSTINAEVRSWEYDISKWDQDINMPRIAKMARTNQPGVLLVDRTVHGPYEDYRTPEQSVPDKALPYPWESNMTMTDNWGYCPNANFKTAEKIVRTLIDVVSKGGNFLLNVAPSPDGTFEETALSRLKEIGEWMNVNSEAIYATRQWITFGEGKNLRFTTSKDGKYLYVFAYELPNNTLSINSLKTTKKLSAKMLGSNAAIKSELKEGVYTLTLPASLQSPKARPSKYASVFKITLK
ncbi:MAG: alpha-L-fucosidase [Bacteroidota bacterium]